LERELQVVAVCDQLSFKVAICGLRNDDVIRNWLRNRNTVEFLGVWERLNNPDSNPVEFDGIGMQTGLNSFVLTPKRWVDREDRRDRHQLPCAIAVLGLDSWEFQVGIGSPNNQNLALKLALGF